MSHGPSDIDGGFLPAIGDDFGDGLAEDLRARVKSELEPGERLLWVARSSPPPVRTGKGHIIAFGIGLLLASGGVVLTSLALGMPRHPGGDDMMMVGLGLTALGGLTGLSTIGVRIAAGSLWVRQANTIYAVTDRRAIFWIPESKDGAVRVRSLGRRRIQDIVRVERPDGTGTLEFILPAANPEYPVSKEEFKHIPEVRRADQLVRNHLLIPEKIS